MQIELPLVSVVMPVYNAAPFLEEAIYSILKQSYRNFELIIINDGSYDRSKQIIHQFRDERIRCIEHENNIGIAKARKRGIQEARGKYIFWMDADDVSLPGRIEKQVAYFEKESALVLLGTFADSIDELGIFRRTYSYGTGSGKIKAALLFGFPFLNPTIGIRTKAIQQTDLNFLDEVSYAQDYVIISKLTGSGAFDNLPEVLMKYREYDSPTRVTQNANAAEIIRGRMTAWTNLLAQLELKTNTDILSIHDKMSYYPNRLKYSETAHFPGYLDWLVQIKQQNRKLNVFDQLAFETNIASFAERTLCHPLLPLGSFTGLWWKHASLIKTGKWLKIPWKWTRHIIVNHLKRILGKS